MAPRLDCAVNEMGGAGVAYFSYNGNEYFIATNNTEATVSANDAIVELVGVTNIHHAATARTHNPCCLWPKQRRRGRF
jgi:hypothetical protein